MVANHHLEVTWRFMAICNKTEQFIREETMLYFMWAMK